VVATLLLGALGARLWFLQTVEAEALQSRVDESRTRTILVPPERGQVFDADGRLLAGNDEVLNVVVSWDVLRTATDRAAVFQRLSGWVGVPVEEMEARFDSGDYSPLRPLPVAEDVSEEVVTALRERSEDFPGVSWDRSYRRVYPYAPLAAHVVGYMGAITAEDEAHYKALGYDTSKVGEDVGRSGVELYYETLLHGEWGRIVYEIDSAGHIVREVSRSEPVNGNDIQLSIDLDLQQYAESLLQAKLRVQRGWQAENPFVRKPNGTRARMSPNHGPTQHYSAPAGAVTVMDHETGAVRAMASYPTFDARWFGAGISSEKFEELFVHKIPGTERDDPDRSAIINRAVQGQYNLGSTFKPFVAYAALESNMLTPGSYYHDDGIYESFSLADDDRCARKEIKCEWRNAVCGNGYPCQYGSINVAGALAVSSDAFFYRIGETLFVQPGTNYELLGDWIKVFAFGRDTGIDLPHEFDGRVPDNENKAELVEAGVLHPSETPRLLLGDVVNMAIGQGLMAATPIQLAVNYGALANGGYLMVPRVIHAIYPPNTPAALEPGYGDLGRAVPVETSPPQGNQIPMPTETREAIVHGLRDNVLGIGRNGRTTTAGELFGWQYNSLPWTIDVAGKTGTAQGANSFPWNDSSVFAAFSLEDEHPYTVVAYLEKAGYGSRAAGPVVKCLFLALSDETLLAPVEIADPLDVTSDRLAQPAPQVDLSCMTGTDGDNIRPRPPTITADID